VPVEPGLRSRRFLGGVRVGFFCPTPDVQLDNILHHTPKLGILRTPAASNGIRSGIFFAVSRLDLDFVFAEKKVTACFLHLYLREVKQSRIVCVRLVPDPERIRNENLQNKIGSRLKKSGVSTL